MLSNFDTSGLVFAAVVPSRGAVHVSSLSFARRRCNAAAEALIKNSSASHARATSNVTVVKRSDLSPNYYCHTSETFGRGGVWRFVTITGLRYVIAHE